MSRGIEHENLHELMCVGVTHTNVTINNSRNSGGSFHCILSLLNTFHHLFSDLSLSVLQRIVLLCQ